MFKVINNNVMKYFIKQLFKAIVQGLSESLLALQLYLINSENKIKSKA